MTNEKKAKEKKDHPILYGVAILVISGTIMLIVTTIYNLFLAHIWPVTIHFGEYSLANVIYIMVSVLTSVVISFIAFYFAIFYALNAIFMGLFGFLLTPEQRAKKGSWLARLANGVAYFFMLPFYIIDKLQKIRKPPEKSESVQQMLEKLQQKQSENEESHRKTSGSVANSCGNMIQ